MIWSHGNKEQCHTEEHLSAQQRYPNSPGSLEQDMEKRELFLEEKVSKLQFYSPYAQDGAW